MNHVSAFRRAFLAISFGLLLVSADQPSCAAEPILLNRNLLSVFVARPIGPANMGGRVVDVAVVESRPKCMYVATASGGLWRTVNNGITWTPVFDHQKTIALGCVAVAPSNPGIVWVGTGEANARNSVSWGDGVYRSTDGGKTWQNMGLEDSAHIGRILIRPDDPNTVYVAALGHLWGPNQQRGLYKTQDGGRSWKRVAFLDENTGFIDLVMDSSDPATLYAAAYHCRRDPFSGPNPKSQFSPRAGLYKTSDGGETWVKLSQGLPDCRYGRCGLAICRRDPHIVYAVIQTEKTDIGSLPGQAAKTSSKIETGGIFRSEDRGQTWAKLNDLCPRPFYYSQIRIDPNDAKRIYVLGIKLHISEDGGRTFRDDGARGIHGDHHALWIDPGDTDHLVLGCDGGLNFSYDRGVSWERLRNLPIGQFYAITVDMRKPYRIYGGLQDNGTWVGPSATYNADGITFADWFPVAGGDGFRCQVDRADPEIVYVEGQYGRLQRVNLRTGMSRAIQPTSSEDGPTYRFNWNSPLLVSPHDPPMLYFGGNRLFRSGDRGDRWEVFSPDLTCGKPGPSSNRGHTLTAIAESPLVPGLLYAGSDDGRIHVSKYRGASWTDITNRIPRVPPARSISCIECSHFAAGTAYLTLDRHRLEDNRPYVFKTADFGATWHPLANNLPADGPVHVLREDLRNKNLLFVGTEFGLFASLDAGKSWQLMDRGMPTVAIHDLVIHPRERDLVIATHGRSLYVMDIAPLEELTPQVLAAAGHLFDIKPATLFRYRDSRGNRDGKSYAAPNPPFGATLYYFLGSPQQEPVQITITDALGERVAEIKGAQSQGLHQQTWALERARTVESSQQASALIEPGDYIARLQIGNLVLAKKLRLAAEP
jgi:photosystem II stability/assembly factor-like uncharacterized protein